MSANSWAWMPGWAAWRGPSRSYASPSHSTAGLRLKSFLHSRVGPTSSSSLVAPAPTSSLEPPPSRRRGGIEVELAAEASAPTTSTLCCFTISSPALISVGRSSPAPRRPAPCCSTRHIAPSSSAMITICHATRAGVGGAGSCTSGLGVRAIRARHDGWGSWGQLSGGGTPGLGWIFH
jgi:hypothetical protein